MQHVSTAMFPKKQEYTNIARSIHNAIEKTGSVAVLIEYCESIDPVNVSSLYAP